MMVAIHQPQYLPWVPYCDKVAACDVMVYLDNVQFQRNGVQNRNQIKTLQGPIWLTVPVNASLNLTIRETPVVGQFWQKKHLHSIEQNYSLAPYRHWIDDEFRKILEEKWAFLADLNIAMTGWMFEKLGIQTFQIRASSLVAQGQKTDLVLAICKEVGGTTYYSGLGAKGYLDEAKMKEEGVEVRWQQYTNQVYPQCHSSRSFIPDLSALDLILNMGPEAREIMLTGRKN